MGMRTASKFPAFFVFLAFLAIGTACSAQQPASNGSMPSANATNPNSGPVSPNSAGDNGRIVRDPVTGRVYFQQWVTETVPIVRWENKQITTTVYENQVVNQVVPTNQTVYQPQTQYVLQPYWKGAWNPFQQPTLAYQSKPVTNWVPITVTQNQVVPRQQVVPKQQTITVPQPITETKTQQRLVQTEIPQPSNSVLAQPQPLAAYTAGQPRALFNVPLLARQPFPPPTTFANVGNNNSRGMTPATVASSAYPTTASSGWTATRSYNASTIQSAYTNPLQPNQLAQGQFAQGQFAQNQYSTNQYSMNQAGPAQTALRPVSRVVQSIFPPSYNAPLRTASGQGGSWNQMQSGMSATVLR